MEDYGTCPHGTPYRSKCESCIEEAFAKLDDITVQKNFTQREQKLVDIMFEITLMVANQEYFRDKSDDEIAAWVAAQLRDCGFLTVPCGASWGLLTEKPLKNVKLKRPMLKEPKHTWLWWLMRTIEMITCAHIIVGIWRHW